MSPLADLPALPRRLAAAEPGWTETTDVVVVGSGVAGLTAALHLREQGLHVTVVTKVNIDDGSTRWAQGGIAGVLDPLDTPQAHAYDTEIAGVGLCDPDAVRVLVEEGPARIRELIRRGAEFDRNPDGSLMLTREGGHRADRIVHAGGDATGAEVQRALHAAVRRDPWIRLVEHALVLDLLRAADGRACGITLHVLGEGSEDGVGAILARAVVLATGGMGQIYASTTNPSVSTGDGVALALRAGAAVTDVEFVQFHPTSFVTADLSSVQRPLISEALRGEGAHLVDEAGTRFMVGQHEQAELAPRDVVAKGIYRVLRATGADHVYLDARHLGREFLESRFPTIMASTRAAGVDPATELIPVAPAAHYASGGVRTDLHGRTSIAGLYACGEVACTGVHGANRLASNSLLEGLVFAKRIADDIGRDLPAQADPVRVNMTPAWVADASVRAEVQRTMTRGAGVLRTGDSLDTAAKELARLAESRATPNTAAWEATNLLTVATALVASARTRRETRGCHWREDYPTAADEWRGHLLDSIASDGSMTQDFQEMA
ncbi:L-aspartate oxidase [Actinoplanes sp. SE50]|uniref:L-aspartate oxidase n=1 Tax=unclassified Actinoplanes TaxID=2626549 RepID=UPI00023EDFFD|nr:MULTISPECIES: L-aspartate oxidase [unclassified Actinoplanes]AEV88939.1 L-aspartate oxidase [Actinoplanes sp. SE50/110]ATO87345.1 L-aspartate oxidase [Actinoplanes sp. SE50]SLM04763.1 L-aspartate oxidase [Actinoplanes sp. SE50/110]